LLFQETPAYRNRGRAYYRWAHTGETTKSVWSAQWSSRCLQPICSKPGCQISGVV